VGSRGYLRALALVLAVAAALTASGGADAQGTPCGRTPGLLCSSVVVPLDRTGAIPGTVALHVEELPAVGRPQGAIFLIAGGPGQGSAHTFDLGSPQEALIFRYLFPGYTLVAYDDRGTGDSGLLDCPGLQAATSSSDIAEQNRLVSQCASALGPAASLYGTADHAADLDAVRAALGFDQVALYGVSYGTKLALAYAAMFPTHVSRLVLDSVLPTGSPDPFSTNVLRALPATLRSFCATACKAATPDFAGDVVAVANRLAAKPAQGTVAGRKETLKGVDFLSLVIDADLDPGLAAELPAAVHAARLGNVAPLLRLHVLDTRSSTFTAPDLSAALFAATDCRDGPFPWTADTAPAARPAIISQALAALPPGSFGPFGSWASQLGNATLCETWPAPSGGVDLSTGPLPNIPVLALSGGFDMRTPTADAQAVVAQFPQGQLLVVPGVGHSVSLSDPSGCALQAVHNWMEGAASVGQCPRAPFVLAPLAAFPKPVQHAGPQTTLAIVRKTVGEAEASWLIATDSPSPSPVRGLAGGTLTADDGGFRLSRYALVPGITVSGTTLRSQGTLALSFSGQLTVAGSAASKGHLELTATGLSGTLGGRSVP